MVRLTGYFGGSFSDLWFQLNKYMFESDEAKGGPGIYSDRVWILETDRFRHRFPLHKMEDVLTYDAKTKMRMLWQHYYEPVEKEFGKAYQMIHVQPKAGVIIKPVKRYNQISKAPGGKIKLEHRIKPPCIQSVWFLRLYERGTEKRIGFYLEAHFRVTDVWRRFYFDLLLMNKIRIRAEEASQRKCTKMKLIIPHTYLTRWDIGSALTFWAQQGYRFNLSQNIIDNWNKVLHTARWYNRKGWRDHKINWVRKALGHFWTNYADEFFDYYPMFHE